MAVVQISKIQIRRGRKNEGTGLPQLSGGEMAWAVDTQELYIGNGAVSEGAPAVGNTKILTENDSILDLAEQYQYKSTDSSIQTGLDANYPVKRTIQERLDERVNAASYGIVANGQDQAEKLQHAVDNLFLNIANFGETSSRVTLEFSPGTYEISETIYLPSYVSILGSGTDKTIFNFTGTGSVFEFINDSSLLLDGSIVRSTINSTTYNNQPRQCVLRNFTIIATDDNVEFLKLNAVRDSKFENLDLGFAIDPENTGTPAPHGDSIGVGLYALSSIVTCERNKFFNVSINGCYHAVFAKQDIYNNVFDNCEFKDAELGVTFGLGANGSSVGEQYGPRKNTVKNSFFYAIRQHGILVEVGYGNRSRGNTFEGVGNGSNGDGGNTNGLYSQIKFTSIGNVSLNDSFDRAIDLSSNDLSSAYVSEVEGKTFYQNFETYQVNLGQATTPVEAFRLPLTGSSAIEINYLYQSITFEQMRKGQLQVAVDFDRSNVQVVDEYEYTGTTGDEENIEFTASIVDDSLVIYYTNDNLSDTATLTYTYSNLS